MGSEFTWSMAEETVKCCNCFGNFEDHEVVQRSNVRGIRQYACFACVQELEEAEDEAIEEAA